MQVFPRQRKVVLNLRNPEMVLRHIPEARNLEVQGHRLTAVPYNLRNCYVLKAMGVHVPSPIRHYYDWPCAYGSPWSHQIDTAEFLVMNPRAFCLNGMGTAKTLSTLWAFHFLKSLGILKRALVVSPLSTLERTWADEIFRNFPDLSCVTLHGSRERRHRLLASEFDVYIINHDGLNKDTVKLINERKDIDLLVIDELAVCRNSRTDRYKHMKAIADERRWVWGLTGTPVPNEPTDAWAQIMIVNPKRVPKFFSHFRERVMVKRGAHKWVERPDSLNVVYQHMQPAIRFSREQCLDLPPTTYATREVPMSEDQEKAYTSMLSKLRAEYKEHLITAANEGVKVMKLAQIACGIAYLPSGESVQIPSSAKLQELENIIEQAEGKVIVFVPFTDALTGLADHLNAKGIRTAVIHGSVTKSERDMILGDFQKRTNLDVLVADARCMSHGLNLTAASVIVWYGPTMSNEVYEQANMRIPRPGQRLNTHIIHLVCSGVERKIFKRLEKKGRMQGILLELFEEAFDRPKNLM